jgi:ATP-dependent DNA helicase RecQ
MDLQYVREADKAEMHQLLVSLAQRGIITYIPRSVGCCIEMTRDRETEIWLSPAVFEERMERFADKLKAMVEYAEQDTFCREQLLLAYFGETDAEPCGHCDVCLDLAKHVSAD